MVPWQVVLPWHRFEIAWYHGIAWHKINDLVPGHNSPTLSRFEMAWYPGKWSPWCSLFEEEDFEAFEFR